MSPCFATGNFKPHHLFWRRCGWVMLGLAYDLSASESRQDAEYGRALDALVKAVRGVSATRAQLVCPALPAFVGAGSVALGNSH